MDSGHVQRQCRNEHIHSSFGKKLVSIFLVKQLLTPECRVNHRTNLTVKHCVVAGVQPFHPAELSVSSLFTIPTALIPETTALPTSQLLRDTAACLTCSSMSISWLCCLVWSMSSTVSPRAAASSVSSTEPWWKPLSADGGRLADTPPRENCSRRVR